MFLSTFKLQLLICGCPVFSTLRLGQNEHHIADDIQDDVIKWKHFPCYWPFVRGIHRSAVNSPHKGQWRGAFMYSLICAWINRWVNNREAGDSRRPLWRHCNASSIFFNENHFIFFFQIAGDMLVIYRSPTASFCVFNWWAILNKMKWITSWTFPVNIGPMQGNKLNVTFIHQFPWIAIRWISTFVRAMACNNEVASHYLNTIIALDLWRRMAPLNRNILYKSWK